MLSRVTRCKLSEDDYAGANCKSPQVTVATLAVNYESEDRVVGYTEPNICPNQILRRPLSTREIGCRVLTAKVTRGGVAFSSFLFSDGPKSTNPAQADAHRRGIGNLTYFTAGCTGLYIEGTLS